MSRRWISPFALARRGILGMNRRNISYIGRYNPRSRYPLVDDKLRTKLIAEKARINVPALLHVVRTQHEIEAIENDLASLTRFVIKPAQGSGGKGILVAVDRDGDTFVRGNGTRIGLAGIKRHLSNILSGLHSLGGKQDVAIIEDLVEVSPMFADVSHEGVPDIRIVVFRGYPVMGMLRLATHASDGKANLHQGAIGVGLDMATGTSVAAVQNNRLIRHHPDTGASLDRICIPDWETLLNLAARCYEVTGLGYMGCDMVIDRHRGPLLLEMNARPGLSIQIANDEGLVPRLEHLESLEDYYVTVEDRVAYAMSAFSRAPASAQSSPITPKMCSSDRNRL
ncbi:MAG: alpha-L-glutamate ligase-like protein [Pseudomonadota bacterium]